MSNEDFKSHAINSEIDFYALLGDISEGAGEGEIRRAYRKTALKYHPDKIRPEASVAEKHDAAEKFHLTSIAYEVLHDPALKELYDRARRARQQKAERASAYDTRRKQMIDDLERRERESQGFKRKRTEEEEEFDQKLQRLAADGKRRREEYAERLRKEAEEEEAREQAEQREQQNGGLSPQPEVTDQDRQIALRFPKTDETAGITEEVLRSRFERFGPIDLVLVRDKKVKIEGMKHRQPYAIAVLEFKSIVGAHAVIFDFEKIRETNPEDFGMFENVRWAAGKEPDCIKTSASASQNRQNNAHYDDILMIRLKNAQRKRDEEKGRREEAAAAAVTATADAVPPPEVPHPNGKSHDSNRAVPSFKSFKPKSGSTAKAKESDAEKESRRAEARRQAIEEIKRQDAAEDGATATDNAG